MIIRHNIPGINASRNKGISEGKMKKNLEKLSSGYRINRAGDDAAGLAISELMRSQIRGLDQAIKNCDDGIGITETGDGALTEVHSMLERMKTLAIQSANGTYSTIARENLDAERSQLLKEIDRIGQSSHVNEISLFDDASTATPPFQLPEQCRDVANANITLQIGCTAGEILDIPRYYMSSKALDLVSTSFLTQKDANASVQTIDDAIEAISDIRASFGAAENHLEHTHNNLSVTTENMTAAESHIRDTDMAQEFTEFTKANIVYQSANAMAGQANSAVEIVLRLLQ